MLKESKIITNELCDLLLSAHYQVTTILPLVENPIMNIYHFHREEFDDFLERYGDHGEFIVSVEQVPETM